MSEAVQWRMVRRWLALAFSSAVLASAAVFAAAPSYQQWTNACARLPSNRSLRGEIAPPELLPLRSFGIFDEALDSFFDLCRTGSLSRATNWLGAPADRAGFFDTDRAWFLKPRSGEPRQAFQPFAQKTELPAHAEVFFHADLHGDVHSLLADLRWLSEHGCLRGFEITRPDFYMTFLGDYTDRGRFGVEVLYTLLRLKIANPDHVFLGRGNHEDVSIQSRYGFLQEGRAKYGSAFNAAKIMRAYDFLPVVMYLGSGENFIQCNHGGMEPGYNPRELLAAPGTFRIQTLGELRQQDFLKAHPDWPAGDSASRELAARVFENFTPEAPISPSFTGFMWNDFTVLSSEPQFSIDPGRAFVYGAEATRGVLEAASTPQRRLQAVFRGHQQSSALNPLMRRIVAGGGAFRHWQSGDSPALLNRPVQEIASHLESAAERPVPAGSVWTFNVSPDSVYGENCGFNFDAFGLLKISPEFKDWRMRIVSVQVNSL